MKINKTSKFEKIYKKLHNNQLSDVNITIKKVISDPYIGTLKSGDLNYLRVYKFKMVGQLTLLGYMITEDNEIILTLIASEVHENFYRDLKQ